MLDRFRGCLLGVAIGDALGLPFEGMEGPLEVDLEDLSPGRYSDDTAMTLAVADSILRVGDVDGDDLALSLSRAYFEEPWRGYGPGPPRVFEMMRGGLSWREALDRRIYPGGSMGNGAAMRVAPLGLLFGDDLEGLREKVEICSRITHSHPLAMEGAYLQACAVALASRSDPNAFDRSIFLEKLISLCELEEYRERLEEGLKILRGFSASPEDVLRALRSGTSALDSVPSAVVSFLAGSSFEEVALRALSLGGDADTVCSMALALAGALWGEGAIRGDWVEGVEGSARVKALADGLFGLYSRRSREEAK